MRSLWRAALVAFVLGCASAFPVGSVLRTPPGRRSFTAASNGLLLRSAADSPEGDDGKTPVQDKKRLSRPERKALARVRKKEAGLPTSQKFQRTKEKQRIRRYELHSTAVSELAKDSSPDDVIRAIKRAQKNHDNHDLRVVTRFLLEETDDSFAYGFKGALLARLAVAALHLQSHTSAERAITKRRIDFRSSMLPLESAAIVRNLLRVHNVTDAWNVLDDELSLPLEGTCLTDAENKDRLKYRARSLASIVSRHLFEGEPFEAVYACERLASLGRILSEAEVDAEELDLPWHRLLRGAAQCQSGIRDGQVSLEDPIKDGNPSEHSRRAQKLPCNVVYAVLNAMLSVPSTNSDRVYEVLSNALVRRVLFITGAVAMDGCPPADRGEAAFIGRSNVGKSSLVNMVTNRKSLAYTSKRPGKTQQINFFAVNDKPGREKEVRYGDDIEGEKDNDSFNLVDLPGFGYAKVPAQQRQQWLEFMDEYLSSRKTLRVLFHLVDGRHGPTGEDGTIMRRVSEMLPDSTRYVVVITKADKNVKGPNKTNTGKVSKDVVNLLRKTMEANGVGTAPVILTSAETKLGRDEVWNYLRLAAETRN
jgi:GTP-binding protein